jgi:hypothetical protein
MIKLKKLFEYIQIAFGIMLIIGILILPFTYLDSTLPSYTVMLYFVIASTLSCVAGIIYAFYKVFMKKEATFPVEQ